jgi:hypothetical protein
MLQQLKGHGVNIATLALIAVGFFYAAFVLYVSHHKPETWRYLLLGIIAICFFACVFNYRRLLKISEAPISTIAAAAQGYVELYGIAKTEKPIKTPYQNIPCVWYRSSVYANRESQDENLDQFNVMPLEYTESKTTFTLDDGTAQCTVNPEGAEVVYFEARTWRKNDHRYVEEYLPADKSIYVIGQLDTRKDVYDEASFNRDLSATLADWKTRPQQLLNRYDQNRDGEIDVQEWELARQDAIKQVKAEHAMQANLSTESGSNFTIAKPSNQALFLISAKAPQQLRNDYKTWVLVYLGILSLLLIFYLKAT